MEIIMTALNPNDGYAVLINTFQVKPGRADDLVSLLSNATEETVQHVPGFISANLHVSEDGRRVVNYAQWRSKSDFEKAMQVPEFQAHMKQVKVLIESFDPVLYQLRYSESR
jgi:quinol monooxygenase YgiN